MDLDVHLDAIRAGDAEAFAAWLAGAEPVVRRGLRSFAHTVDTEAVIQEALLRVWQVAPRIQDDGRPNSLLRFATRVARNLAIDHTRRASVDVEEGAELDQLAQVDGSGTPDPLLRRAIAACWSKLRGAPARALKLRVMDHGGRPDVELAAACGMRLNTFLKNIGRAREQLAACLGRQGVAIGARS